jgi:MerR family transcriptional regulator/heat shock protein HspR
MSDRAEPTVYYRLEVAAEMARLPAGRLRRYVSIGLVHPARVQGTAVLFDDRELRRLRKIRRLSTDLGLDTAGIEIVLRLLDEIDALRAALADRQPSRPPGGG